VGVRWGSWRGFPFVFAGAQSFWRDAKKGTRDACAPWGASLSGWLGWGVGSIANQSPGKTWLLIDGQWREISERKGGVPGTLRYLNPELVGWVIQPLRLRLQNIGWPQSACHHRIIRPPFPPKSSFLSETRWRWGDYEVLSTRVSDS